MALLVILAQLVGALNFIIVQNNSLRQKLSCTFSTAIFIEFFDVYLRHPKVIIRLIVDIRLIEHLLCCTVIVLVLMLIWVLVDDRRMIRLIVLIIIMVHIIIHFSIDK